MGGIYVHEACFLDLLTVNVGGFGERSITDSALVK